MEKEINFCNIALTIELDKVIYEKKVLSKDGGFLYTGRNPNCSDRKYGIGIILEQNCIETRDGRKTIQIHAEMIAKTIISSLEKKWEERDRELKYKGISLIMNPHKYIFDQKVETCQFNISYRARFA